MTALHRDPTDPGEPGSKAYPPSVLWGVVDAAGHVWGLTLAGAITVDDQPVEQVDLPEGLHIQCGTVLGDGGIWLVLVDGVGRRTIWRGRVNLGGSKHGDQTQGVSGS